MSHWVKQNQKMNYGIGAIVFLYGALIVFGQQSLWLVFFKKGTPGTLEWTTLSAFLTNGCAMFAFCYGALSFFVAKVSDKNLNRYLLLINTTLWFLWVVFDWYYFSYYSVLFQFLNIIFSHGVLLGLVIILLNMLKQERLS
tara:strand:+ start:342 stop:764 length:423 start_codon:yes stop_codon:yes gene_type:complete